MELPYLDVENVRVSVHVFQWVRISLLNFSEQLTSCIKIFSQRNSKKVLLEQICTKLFKAQPSCIILLISSPSEYNPPQKWNQDIQNTTNNNNDKLKVYMKRNILLAY